jgi:hypothetical protein
LDVISKNGGGKKHSLWVGKLVVILITPIQDGSNLGDCLGVIHGTTIKD